MSSGAVKCTVGNSLLYSTVAKVKGHVYINEQEIYTAYM